MEDKRILEKIKKLLKLSESNNQHEASLVLERAMELMEKYGISSAKLRISDVQESHSCAMKSYTLSEYQNYLLSSIVHLFGCDAYLTHVFQSGKWRTEPVMVGLSPNAQIAAYCFAVLSKKQEKARSEFLQGIHWNTKRKNKTKQADEFALGWAMGISRTVKRLVPENNTPQPVKEYMVEKTKGMEISKTREVKVSRNEDALYKGVAVGGKIDLNKPINGGKERLQLK